MINNNILSRGYSSVVRNFKFGIYFLLINILTGCVVPNATVYYRPTVDVNSTHEKSHCVPTEKYVHFNLKTKNQILKVRGYGSIYAYGEKSEGQFIIKGKWNKIKYKNKNSYLIVPDTNKKIKPLKIYDELHNYDDYSSFNFSIVFPKPNTDRFDIVFPPLIIDDEEIKLPILHIEKKVWIGISPFNC